MSKFVGQYFGLSTAVAEEQVRASSESFCHVCCDSF
jgi:hypothetical protein